MLVPFLTEAVKVVEEGIMSCEDADKMTVCAGHAMGPITTLDYVGLDTTLAISTILHEELGDAYRPPNLLRQLVRSGCLGLKSGRGFYIWENGKKGDVNPFVKRYRRA
jgi:3-hydroxybutyryl-CoA dehydrogenase